jgi:4-amino-4-deoxy-L-arabinose transferase-like glycosyltransferase
VTAASSKKAKKVKKSRGAQWWLSLLAGLLVSLIAFFVYLRTLAPTVLHYAPKAFPDSVLLQVKAYVLSIPNPTGYPTYILLAHLFTYLPFGDPAFRVNLASAVFAALAVFALFMVCRTLVGWTLPAAAAALLFGLSQAFWSQAIITEVYTLNALTIALVLLSLFVWRERRDGRNGDRYLLLSAFLLGLAVTNHMTSALLIPAAFLFVWLVDRSRLRDWPLVLRGAGLFVLALTPYIYLPVRARMDPPLNETDPSTLGSFLSLVTGANFDSRMLAFGPLELPGRLSMYLELLLQQFSPLFLVVAAVGIGYLAAEDRAALALLGFLYSGWLFYAIEYRIADIYPYFIPTYLIISIFVCAGAFALMELGAWIAGRYRARVERPAFYAVAGLLLAASFLGVRSTYATVDLSDDYRGQKTIESIEQEARPGSTVLHSGSSLWYLREVEQTRPSLNLVDPFEAGEWESATNLWAERANYYLDQGPVYILFPPGTVQKNVSYFEEAGLSLFLADEKQGLYRVERQEGYEQMPLTSP